MAREIVRAVIFLLRSRHLMEGMNVSNGTQGRQSAVMVSACGWIGTWIQLGRVTENAFSTGGLLAPQDIKAA